MPLNNNQGINKINGTQFDDDRVFVKRYLTMFISNWYWFAISLFIAFTLAYGINRYSEKLYVVSSSLLIKDDMISGGAGNSDNFMPGVAMFKSKQNLNNEIAILKSYKLNKRVIDSLPEFRIVYIGVGRRNIVETRMYKTCPIMVIPNNINNQKHREKIYVTILSDSIYSLTFGNKRNQDDKHKFGERIFNTKYDFRVILRDVNFRYNDKESNKYYFYFTEGEGLANNFRNSLNIYPIDKDATLVNITITGYVPAQLTEYLNKLMDIYITWGLEDKNRTADATIKFIDDQLGTISNSLSRAETNLQNFRLKNKLIDLDREGILVEEKLKKLDQDKIEADLHEQYFKYLKNYILSKNESGDIVSPSTSGVADEAIGRLVKDLSTFQLRKKELLLTMNQNLPAVNLANQAINETKQSLFENINSNLEVLDSVMKSIKERYLEVDQELLSLPVTEREMIGIKREFDINNTIYTYLLEKRAETGIARASTVSDNRIIDEAKDFNYSIIKPRKSKNNLKALVLGLFIPGLLITLLYYFNNTIMDNNDITDKTRVPVIGVISHNEDRKELPVIDKPKSALTESFRSVRTALKYFIRDEKNPVIAVTSTITSEGKTFIAVNLASVIAQLGKRVLLVGLDLRKPRIHRILEVENDNGISVYLSNSCEYTDVIKETSINNLYYGQSGPVPPNPTELIDSPRMQQFIEKAKEEFDYIIIDTPPVAIVSDTLLLSRYVDINIFVVRQRYSSKNTLELIQELYSEEKLRNMCIIINDINLSGYYGYGLRYNYNRGYGYSYGQYYYGQYSYGRYGYSEKRKEYYE